MYEYPFGNGQQLNLDWFLAEWKNLLAAWEAEKNGIEGALQAEIDRAEAALADVFSARDAAAQSAANALESKNAAAQSASDASGYLATVRTDANTASNAAQNAAQSESNAAESAQTALASKNTAANSERNAAQSEANANSSKNAAAQSASDADASKRAAAQSAADADASKSTAAQSAEDASDAAASVEASAQQITTNTSDISNLKESTNVLKTALSVLEPTATSADVGKALIAKTVADGKVTEFEFGEAGGGGASAIVNTIENVPVASFDDGTANPVEQIVVGIEPVQSGSGDPAPDNVRPITGWSGANVYLSDADTSNPTTYPITFPTEAGTVYGGTLTNLGSNEWKLRVDHASTTLGTFASWAIDERYPNKQFYARHLTLEIKPHTNVFCSAYKNIPLMSWGTNENYSIGLVGDDPYILVVDNNYTNVNDFKTAVNDVQLVYEFSSPVEYTITTADVIQLLAGYNNVWADTGNINLLQYYVDSKKYIDEQDTLVKALIAPVLDSMVADTALTANDFRIVNNTLYRITTSVASGATLTPNTNCTATTITAVLKTLLS